MVRTGPCSGPHVLDGGVHGWHHEPMISRMIRRASLALAASLAGCMFGTTDPLPKAVTPAFSMTLSGAEQGTLDGQAYFLPTNVAAYRETDPGTKQDVIYDVTPLQLIVQGRSLLQLSILGRISLATYAVRISGDALTPTGVMGSYDIPNVSPGLLRSYQASTGTLTITAINASGMKGTFAIHSARKIEVPAGATTVPAPVATSMDLTGTFTAGYIVR
jgi:hypothetical protein